MRFPVGRSQGQIGPLCVGWPLAGRSPRLARASSASPCAKEPEVRLCCAWAAWVTPHAPGRLVRAWCCWGVAECCLGVRWCQVASWSGRWHRKAARVRRGRDQRGSRVAHEDSRFGALLGVRSERVRGSWRLGGVGATSSS